MTGRKTGDYAAVFIVVLIIAKILDFLFSL